MISWVSLRVSSADARPRRHHRRPAMQDPAHHFILIQHAEVRSLNRASEYTTFQGSDQRAHACAGVLGSKYVATHMNENSGSDLPFSKRSSHLNQHCQIHCSRVGTLAIGVDSTRPASLDCGLHTPSICQSQQHMQLGRLTITTERKLHQAASSNALNLGHPSSPP
jgi:hypothetical protein